MKPLLIALTATITAIPATLVLPNMSLLGWLGIAMMLDLATGIMKAVTRNQARTSTGLQRTVKKFIRYFGAIVLALLVQNFAASGGYSHAEFNKFMCNAVIAFLFYIEVISILENIIALDSEDMLSKYFAVPLHNLLTWKIKGMFTRQDLTNEKSEPSSEDASKNH